MLPGKLCIGILEEDNPLKSYFRLKPILMEAEGKYVHFDGGANYPDDGCIRIVPDKNESSHFKARMRRMGRYCVLDLREHAGENDKIRPNKNYHSDEAERNASIVYSDVVREPAQDMIFEISEELVPGEWQGLAPATPRLLCADQLETWAYTAGESEGAPGHIALDGGHIVEAEFQRFELEGFSGETLRFAIRLPGLMSSIAAPLSTKGEKTSNPSEAEKAAPEALRAEPAREDSKSQRLSPLQLALKAQSGLNPRRNRSLQEIIEDKWRQSRLDQLGHPVPAMAMGKPAENPLEFALEALQNAWRIPELRQRLVSSMCAMEDFSESLGKCSQDMAQSRLRQELEDLEAERLKSLNDLEQLRRGGAKLRAELREQILREEASAFEEAQQRTRAAQQECQRQEQAAAQARRDVEFARDAFAALSDGRFDEKLRDLALTSRAAELLRCPSAPADPRLENVETPDAQTWLERTRRAFAAEGFDLSDAALLNLLVCAALSDAILLSGRASSDREGVARALANAMGATGSGRYAETTDGRVSNALRESGALPCVVLVRNANTHGKQSIDRGLWGASENLIVVSVLEDEGYLLNGTQLDRGFLLRLEPADATQGWGPAAPWENLSAASMASLRAALLKEVSELPAAMTLRMEKIRKALSLFGTHISRHSLRLMWRYCAAMLSLSDLSEDEILDLAFAQKALPCILAEAPLDGLMKLKEILAGMPRSLALLDAPLPIDIG